MHCPRASQSDKAAVQLHVLDPAYTSLSTSPHVKSPLNSVYTDCQGNVHSPDFYAFELPSHGHSHITSRQSTPQPPQELFQWQLDAAALTYEAEDEDTYSIPNLPSSPRRSISSRSSLDYDSPSPSLDSWPSSPSSFEYEDLPEAEEPFSSSLSSDHSLDLKKQWLAVSLRVKTKVYRAKKRLSR